MENNIPTIKELFNALDKGELKEGENYVYKHLMVKDEGNKETTTWIPFAELVARRKFYKIWQQRILPKNITEK